MTRRDKDIVKWLAVLAFIGIAAFLLSGCSGASERWNNPFYRDAIQKDVKVPNPAGSP